MKILLVALLSAVGLFPVINQSATDDTNDNSCETICTKSISNCTAMQQQPDKGGYGRKSVIEFKSQKYCRAEMPADFQFDVRFDIVSATVYFTGANFPRVEKGFINSSSLKTIQDKVDRCATGTIVVFDDVKVKGPDKEVRIIPGITYTLY